MTNLKRIWWNSWGIFGVTLLLFLPQRGGGAIPLIGIPDHDETVECEFLLSGSLDAQASMAWLSGKLKLAELESRAFIDYSPTELAFKELNLPTPWPDDAIMVIDTQYAHAGLYRLRLQSGSKELNSFVVRLPPVAVWKFLNDEERSQLAFGALLGQIGTTRTFASFSTRRNANFLTVLIGLDVDCDQLNLFTKAVMPQLILPFKGADIDLLCRVGVIGANFQLN